MTTLTWEKTAAGYTAVGESNRFYSIVRHGSRFRYATGFAPEPTGTLTAMKAECEKVEAKDRENFEEIGRKNATNFPPVVTRCPKCGETDAFESMAELEPYGCANWRCDTCNTMREIVAGDEQRPDPTLMEKSPLMESTGSLEAKLKSQNETTGSSTTPAPQAQTTRVLSKDLPPQPGDDEPVDPSKPDGVTMGEIFGRKKQTGGQHSSSPCDTDYTPRIIDGQARLNGLSGLSAKLAARSNVVKLRSISLPPHVIVEARAGTGKTTTLITALKVLRGIDPGITPSVQQKAVWDAVAESKDARTVAFVAFNKTIAEELKSRVPHGCEAMTMHSLGYRAVRKEFGNPKMNADRVSDILSRLYGVDIRDLFRTKGPTIKAVKDLVDLAKMNLTGRNLEESYEETSAVAWGEELAALASHYGTDLEEVDFEEVVELVPRVLEACKDVRADGCIDFADMVWLPVALGLPVQKFDLLLIDERQDLNKCQMHLALKAGHRIVAVGDKAQAIYGFAGADANACENFTKMLEGTGRAVVKIPLTVTRRCGKAIVAEAKKIVPDFDAFPTNPDGKVSHSSMDRTAGERHYSRQAADGDMVLCRVNAPLVSECFRFLREGRKATILGRDIGQGLISTIRKLAKKADKDNPDGVSVAALVGLLSDWLHDETEKEMRKRIPSDSKVIGLQDRHDCIVCFTDGAKVVAEVIRKVETIFSDDKTRPGVRFASVHRSKGLEAHNVFILLPKGSGMPHPMAKSAWEREQEMNLLYVAITRAVNHLIYVTGGNDEGE